MKVKTITCHDVYNYGASLQAYALATFIKNLGHNIEIIDYKPQYLRHYKLFGVNNAKYNRPVLRELYQFAKMPGRIIDRFSKRKREFDRFTKEYLPLTAQTFYSNEDLKKNLDTTDIFFAGSDQIWNCFFKNGTDPAFYLDFAPESTVKASYAASFSTDTVPVEKEDLLKEWIGKLDAVSVREKSGVRILEKMGINNGVHVVDPVFLLSTSDWLELAEPIKKSKRFVFLYDFDLNKDLGKKVREFAHKNGYSVYSGLKNSYADRCFENCGPRTFLSLVKNAEIVFSNSFHATAFSVIFKKDFWVIDRNEAINSRMNDFVSDLGLSHRKPTLLNCDFEEEIDYSQVTDRLNTIIDESKNYIFDVINKGKINEKKDFIYD